MIAIALFTLTLATSATLDRQDRSVGTAESSELRADARKRDDRLDEWDRRDRQLRRRQIGFGITWALGSLAVIGGGVAIGLGAEGCAETLRCRDVIGGLIAVGVGAPVATVGLIGFAVSTGMRRNHRTTRAMVTLVPGGVGLRF
jgi:hypothetical protein